MKMKNAVRAAVCAAAGAWWTVCAAENAAVAPRADAGRIAGEAVAARKTGRMAWLDSKAGLLPDRPTAPFTDVEADSASRTVRILGRELTLGANGLPLRYRSFFTGSNTRIGGAGRDVLAKGFSFAPADAAAGGGETSSFRFTETCATRAAWRAETKTAGGFAYAVEGELNFDGFATFRVTPAAAGAARLAFALPPDVAHFAMGMGREGGEFPERLEWRWSAERLQDALWMGDVNGGLMIRLKGADYARPLVNIYYKWKKLRRPGPWGAGAVTVARGADGASFAATGEGKAGEPWIFDLHLTPFRTIDLRRHLEDRYAHAGHVQSVDWRAVAAGGATVLNLHHNTVWNPYINYPYNDDGGPLLKEAVKAAHAAGLRLKVYYTTREITQNMPEFRDLAALGGEVIFRRPAGTSDRTDICPGGADPRLVALAGKDVLPAWRETINFPDFYPPRPDLAVITNPDGARWNNFYLAGLELLVKEYGIDGVYVDDSALDRAAMLRARRILDADGNRGRRIDMHAWNHFNGYVGHASSAIIYLELYPFVDRLWYGEGFRQNRSAAYWLVERSGIPFGLLGEQLEDLSFDKGMVFAMPAGRWFPCSAKPGPPPREWRFAAEHGLADSEMLGWWDPDNPVKVVGSGDVKATVYRGRNSSVVALANFGGKAAEVRLELKGALPGFSAADFGAAIPLAPGAGVRLVK